MIDAIDGTILAAQIAAERDAPQFTTRAAAVILCHLRQLGEAPGEMLVDLARLHPGCDVRELRAFGPAFQRLVRQGLIRQSGWCVRKRGHRSGGGRIWAAAVQ